MLLSAHMSQNLFQRRGVLVRLSLFCFLGFTTHTALRADNPPGRNDSNRPQLAADLYFVAFRDGLNPGNTSFLQTVGARVERRFPALKTVSVRMSAAILARLQGDSRIEYIEPVPMRYKADLSTSQLVPTSTMACMA